MLGSPQGYYRSYRPTVHVINPAAGPPQSKPSAQAPPRPNISTQAESAPATAQVVAARDSLQLQATAFYKSVDDQCKERFDSRDIIIKGIDSDLWATIKGSCEEETLPYRLEYIADLKQVIITWPTAVHEAFSVSLTSFNEIVASTGTEYTCRYNTAIEIDSTEGPSERIPDFVFARRNPTSSTLDYLIILECAATQDTDSLMKKVDMWLTHPTVRLVIAVDLRGPRYRNPSSRSGVQALSRAQWDELTLSQDRPMLGPIKLRGDTWANGIDKIVVTLHVPGATGAGKEYDLTPVPLTSGASYQQLLTEQDAVTQEIARFTRKVIGKETFKTAFKTRLFDINWPEFYKELERALKDDAYSHFKSVYGVGHSGALKRGRAESEPDSDEDDDLRLFVKHRAN
ncbi:hypothetical protein DFH07DRAFT_1058396 [Mycena maculata]|uniref:Uncharacterized protein n=1 Tax=Mycena maculata TaxID=230809 RepID=A0AAD7JNU6_9AGAR|nr:hypothetical protein DFH07DRAFT_1058396 [Mycena maculata]